VGTSVNTGQLVAKIERYGYGLGNANRKAVTEAAKIYKEGVIRTAKQDVGQDQRIGRWRWNWRSKTYKSLKVSAGYDVRGYSNAVALLKARPMGPWRVLESGARPHSIRPKIVRGKTDIKSGARRSKRVAGRDKLARPIALGFPDGNARFGVMHPGTAGKRTWSRGIDQATPGAMRTFRAVHARTLLDIFT
jgi:hypothetical protein